MYGTVADYQATRSDGGIEVSFTFATDDGQDIEVGSTVPPGDDLLKIANGDRFTANRAMTDMGDRVSVEIQGQAAERFAYLNSLESWKRAEFRTDSDNVQFAAECGWRFDDNDMLYRVAR